MYKSTTKCNETLGKWCKNKHGASKIVDTFETYQPLVHIGPILELLRGDDENHMLGIVVFDQILDVQQDDSSTTEHYNCL
jgi:hypothetical protein